MRQAFRLAVLVLLILTGLWLLAWARAFLSAGDRSIVWDDFRAATIVAAIALLAVCAFLLFSIRIGRFWYRTYTVHRTLLEIEICLVEMFQRLAPRGVDDRRDRMVKIMTEAERCKINPGAAFVVTINKDRGSTQETARDIIDADMKDLASFRSKRRSARLNAFALEAALKGQLKAARNQILVKQKEALEQARQQPEVISALLRLLDLPLKTSLEQIESELARANPVGVFPADIQLAIKIWRHPRHLRFLQDDEELEGWEALKRMRLV